MNTKLLDWYFRLGSTNSKVNEYQWCNLPFPVFADREQRSELAVLPDVVSALDTPDIDQALALCRPLTDEAPFSTELVPIISHAVTRIIGVEQRRGEISRSARSTLAPLAQPYQDFLDRLFYRLAGLTDDEWQGLEERLADML